MNLEAVLESYPDEEFIIATGFNNAVLGVDEYSMRLVYSIEKCVEILMESGMTSDEAQEYFDYNVSGAYIGDRTPIWCFP